MTGLVDLAREIRQEIAKLELVSHAPTKNFEQTARSTSESPGGRKPGRTAEEPFPRDGSNEEKDGWLDAYQRKTPAYYRRECGRILAEAMIHGDHDQAASELSKLLDDLRDTVKRWRMYVIPEGQPPTMEDPEWKRYVAFSGRSVEDLCHHYNCSRQYVQRVRAMEWSARNESRDDEIHRLRAEWIRRQVVVLDLPSEPPVKIRT